MAFFENGKKPGPSNRTVTNLFLSLTFVWVFLGTIDGPTMNVGVDAGSVVYITAKAPERAHVSQLDSLWIGVIPRAPQRVHAAFLLFDFKQNLRHLPNLTGDISRSPPLSTL